MALSSDELERLEQFRDELGIDGDAKAQPDELLQRALGELEIAGGATARESFLLVEAEMRRSAELRAQAAVRQFHSHASAQSFSEASRASFALRVSFAGLAAARRASMHRTGQREQLQLAPPTLGGSLSRSFHARHCLGVAQRRRHRGGLRGFRGCR